MSDSQTPAVEEAPRITVADAVKRVRRTVIEYVKRKDREGNEVQVPRPTKVALSEDEVLSFAERNGIVVVVTRDGQKFSSADA